MGDRITGGDIYANVHENSLMEHRVMLPPSARGNITYIAPAGQYGLTEKVIEIEFGGQRKVSALRTWGAWGGVHGVESCVCWGGGRSGVGSVGAAAVVVGCASPRPGHHRLWPVLGCFVHWTWGRMHTG